MAKEKHPNGLKWLFLTEMWERFGFYTMMAVLTLYMKNTFEWSVGKTTLIYGFFNGTVYFFPILGGWIADRWWGQVKAVRYGAIIMGLGYAVLSVSSVERLPVFFAGLLIITIGSGFLKANISVLVGNLYKEGSPLKDAGFNIFYMGINIGAFAAPWAATFLHRISVSEYIRNDQGDIINEITKFNSYNASFLLAAFGMVACVIIFLLSQKTFAMADMTAGKRKDENLDSVELQTMSKEEEFQRYLALGGLIIISAFFWSVFYQNGASLTYFADDSTRQYPLLIAETYQSINPFFIVALTPLLVLFFKKLRAKGKEPLVPTKIFWGCIIAGFWPLVMVAASYFGGDKDQNLMSPLWLIGAYLIVTISEILISPMGLSYISKVAPPRVRGLSMGFWFGSVGAGAILSGVMCRWMYAKFPHHTFFMVLSGLLFFSAILVLLFKKQLQKFGA